MSLTGLPLSPPTVLKASRLPLFTDIIGVCKSADDVSRITTRTSREVSKRTVCLVDTTGKNVAVTLWGEEVITVESFLCLFFVRQLTALDFLSFVKVVVFLGLPAEKREVHPKHLVPEPFVRQIIVQNAFDFYFLGYQNLAMSQCQWGIEIQFPPLALCNVNSVIARGVNCAFLVSFMDLEH